MTLWLIGMMGAGKTTVGSIAASAVGAPFYDTDSMVEEATGRTISTIWADEGEDAFRLLEAEAVTRVPPAGCMAAAGGGAVVDRRSRLKMTGDGPVVWLQCSVDELARRIDDPQSRPLFAGSGASVSDTLKLVLERRSGAYSDAATHVIVTDHLSPEETAEEVIRIWNS